MTPAEKPSIRFIAFGLVFLKNATVAAPMAVINHVQSVAANAKSITFCIVSPLIYYSMVCGGRVPRDTLSAGHPLPEESTVFSADFVLYSAVGGKKYANN